MGVGRDSTLNSFSSNIKGEILTCLIYEGGGGGEDKVNKHRRLNQSDLRVIGSDASASMGYA